MRGQQSRSLLEAFQVIQLLETFDRTLSDRLRDHGCPCLPCVAFRLNVFKSPDAFPADLFADWIYADFVH